MGDYSPLFLFSNLFRFINFLIKNLLKTIVARLNVHCAFSNKF